MTVNFALFLSPEGIALAHRQDAGHWALIGEVPFAVADLAAQIVGLKAMVGARGGAEAQVLLVLPDDQILYTSFTAPTHDAGLVTDRIIAGLDGLTPYPVADLVYDWRAVEQDRIKVAVVAARRLMKPKSLRPRMGSSPPVLPRCRRSSATPACRSLAMPMRRSTRPPPICALAPIFGSPQKAFLRSRLQQALRSRHPTRPPLVQTPSRPKPQKVAMQRAIPQQNPSSLRLRRRKTPLQNRRKSRRQTLIKPQRFRLSLSPSQRQRHLKSHSQM